METIFWVLAILAVVVILIIYIITSVGSYSDSFVGRFFKDKDNKKNNKGID
ncbi:MAG: hypothetical protein M3R36_00630 [Bacteroidota bacterium]|nr:hypothetical protein [Bacteroidota bacterium]